MDYFDALETRDPAQRERELFAALPAQVAHAKANAPHFAKRFAGVDPRAIGSRRALATLPLTHKSEVHALQQAAPPFGGLATIAPGAASKIFVSAGPIYEPEGKGPDYWRLARALHAAGFRAGDLVQNCFSYHLSPAASMLDGALAALGCAVIPGGTGQTEIQAQTIAQLGVVGYVGTPSFLKLIVEKADEMNLAVGSLRKALVSGEAFPPSLRDALVARGIQAYQTYAIADLGTIAYESTAREGLLIDEGIIVEIVDPGTGDPVPDGEVGEVVVTTFSREYPLIRFATGDLSAVLPGRSPCGRTNMRIKGWMGRADQATKVRGLFVYPHQVAEVVKRVPAVQRTRIVVDNPDGNDRMRVLCSVAGGASENLRGAIEEAVRDITRMRAEVEFVETDSLPNDGKVIEDLRKIV